MSAPERPREKFLDLFSHRFPVNPWAFITPFNDFFHYFYAHRFTQADS
jgi:hypothetical protein